MSRFYRIQPPVGRCSRSIRINLIADPERAEFSQRFIQFDIAIAAASKNQTNVLGRTRVTVKIDGMTANDDAVHSRINDTVGDRQR